MSNQITITGGAKVRNLEGVLTGTAGLVGALPINVANGIPQLDSSGKILVSQLPNSVMEFLGTWNAAINTPTLANGTGNAGDVYLCNVAGTVNFGAGPITFSVGDYVVYSGSTWERSGGAVGTVTSVAASITGNSVGLTGSPITTAGTLAFAFAGTNLQYINGAGNLTTFPTLITSIGLSMPSAFSVANSPLTANGTIAVTGAGTASQYIRGDGQLATMPSTGGGGSAVYYYLNGSVNASVAGYKQMSNTAVVGTGTDFNLVGNGLIAEFLTDAGNPNRLQIPSGAWNFEIFFSMSSSGGNQKFYLDLLKYNGSTFTLIASTSLNPEEITGGTTTDLYITSMAVPETTLLVTDRLALRVYIVDNSSGRTSTLHTENGNLCQIVTTFSAGVTSLNGLTANTQYLAVGTGGSDFNINSLVDTHTFNLPTASATKRGALSSADWTLFNGKQDNLTFYSPLVKSGVSVTIPQATGSVDGFLDSADWTTFNNKVPYTGATANVDLGFKSLFAGRLTISGVSAGGAGGLQFYRTNNFEIPSFDGISTIDAISNNFRFAIGIGTSLYKDFQFNAGSLTNNTTRTYTLPDATGTIALTSNLTNMVTGTGTTNYLPKFTGASTIGNSLVYDNGTQVIIGGITVPDAGLKTYVTNGTVGLGNYLSSTVGYIGTWTNHSLGFAVNGSNKMTLDASGNFLIGTTTDAGYKLDVNGTGRFSGALTGTSATFSGNVRINAPTNGTNKLIFGIAATDYYWIEYNDATGNIGYSSKYSHIFYGGAAGTTQILSLANNGAATFSSSLGIGGAFSFNNGSITSSGELSFNSAALNIYTYGRVGLANLGRIIFNNGTGANLFFGEMASSVYGFTAGGYNSTPVFAMNMGTGNVGIGTSLPQTLRNTTLDISNTSGTNGVGLCLSPSTSGLATIRFGNTNTVGWDLNYNVGNIGALQFYNNVSNDVKLMLTSGGNVLIGTTTDAGYLLQVAGTVNSTNVFRSTNGFMNSYESYNAWELGNAFTTTLLTLKTTSYVTVRINGSVYKLATVN